MNTILEQFQKKINGTFAFFDRMIIKGYLFPFFSVSGRMYFLSQMNLLLKDFSAYANQMTNDLVSYVEKMAAKEGRPFSQHKRQGHWSFGLHRDRKSVV